MPCHGNGADHCCWIGGDLCPFLEENTVQGRRWSCQLYRELGSWQAVAADARYQDEVIPRYLEAGIPPGFHCWDYPNNWHTDEGGRCCYGKYTLDDGNASNS